MIGQDCFGFSQGAEDDVSKLVPRACHFVASRNSRHTQLFDLYLYHHHQHLQSSTIHFVAIMKGSALFATAMAAGSANAGVHKVCFPTAA